MQDIDHEALLQIRDALDELLTAARTRNAEVAHSAVRLAGKVPTAKAVDFALAMLVGPDRQLGDRTRDTLGPVLASGPAGLRTIAAGLVGRWIDLTGEVPSWVR